MAKNPYQAQINALNKKADRLEAKAAAIFTEANNARRAVARLMGADVPAPTSLPVTGIGLTETAASGTGQLAVSDNPDTVSNSAA